MGAIDTVDPFFEDLFALTLPSHSPKDKKIIEEVCTKL